MGNRSLPTTSLEGFHALVCGASSGIGRAVAHTLADRGARVTALARRREELETLVSELEQDVAADPDYCVADLEQREGLEAEIEALLDDRGPIHILVNNSGGPPSGPLLHATEKDFNLAFGRHVLGAHLLVRMLLPGMVESGYGRIVNIVSTSVREPIPNLGVSNTIRGAVASWSKSLSRELPPSVTINNILPGFTDTDRLHSLGEAIAHRSKRDVAAVHADWLREVPERRFGQPEEVAAALAFLVSPAGAYVRGQSVAVDGGRLRSI